MAQLNRINQDLYPYIIEVAEYYSRDRAHLDNMRLQVLDKQIRAFEYLIMHIDGTDLSTLAHMDGVLISNMRKKLYKANERVERYLQLKEMGRL